MILWLEVWWETRVAELWLSIAVERSESDSPAPGLKTIGANGDHAYVVEMTRFQAGDSDGRLLVCWRLTHCELRHMLDVVCSVWTRTCSSSARGGEMLTNYPIDLDQELLHGFVWMRSSPVHSCLINTNASEHDIWRVRNIDTKYAD